MVPLYIARAELVPMRVTPREMTRTASSMVRMPPEALTPTLGPECLRMSLRSASWAPLAWKLPSGCLAKPKPVEVLT